MKYNVTQRLHGAKLYLCVCCHSDHHDPCITGSRMVARQTDFLEASELAIDLFEGGYGRWEVEPVVEEPSTITISLADPNWESRLTQSLGI